MLKMKREMRCVIRYLLIAFLLPLVSIVLQSAIENEIAVFLLYGIQAASPSIAAIVEIKFFEKKRFGDYFKFSISMIAILVPLFLACFTMLFSKSIYALYIGDKTIIAGLSTKEWIIVLWALIAEEFGWRGFLEPYLRRTTKHLILATLITGIIWSCWHYHYFIQNSMEVPIMLFVAGAVIESFIYSYLLEITDQNLLSSMIYHFSWNLFLHLLLINPSYNNGSIVPYTCVIIFEFVIVLIMNTVKRKVKGFRGVT